MSFFGRDGVNFLHSSSYGAVFWICDENSVDNTLFQLFLSSAYMVFTKVFSVSLTVLPVRRLGVHEKLGGGHRQTANPN